jgi:uncharacterized protein YkwD
MKYYLAGTFGVLITVIASAGTAQADVSSIPTNRPVRSSPVPTNFQPTQTPMANSLELAIHAQINRYRQSRNLPPLAFDPTISAHAKAHSEAMAKMSNLNHDGFNERLDSVAETINYKSAAENVAVNQGYPHPDLTAVQGWIDSPGHHQNIIGNYNLTGIGVAQNSKGEYYFTQIFVRKS